MQSILDQLHQIQEDIYSSPMDKSFYKYEHILNFELYKHIEAKEFMLR